ncbi:capsular biosynthesis protein [Alkalihalophilus pseudofirmus]|uniref:CpsD/CapB family tyrosine-protein kinase n=1 Tax=Alkalihalophilus pseudofirmus TaxID=79885 RepID=UPI00095101A7|nr:capsular biosynthesis protein [Alkalihalophilus pseudofirmus]
MLKRNQSASTRTQQQRKVVSHSNPKSPIAEQYRTLRTNIQFANMDGQEIRSILVTSAGPGEGKSTTIANLSIVLAQQGKRVLLLDADLRKPTVHYTFQVDNTFGLTNVLTKQHTLSDAVKETKVEELHVLTCGPIPPNPSELLSSKAMADLLEEAFQYYDYVLLDTPPTLAVTDAQILANLTDGSILVVSSGKTNRDGAKKAAEQLKQAQAKLIGAVLNDKKKDNTSYYYYYGDK